MANPYHDGEGKFCSPGEMLASAGDLISSGKWDEAKQLYKEYDEITDAKHNKGFNEQTVENNTQLASLAKYVTKGDFTIHQAVITQDWSEKDLEEAKKLAEQKEKLATKDLEDLKKDINTENAKFSKSTGGVFSSGTQMLYARDESLEAGDNLLKDLRTEMIKEGIPAGYASYYVGRAGAKLGIKDGYDDYKGRVIPRSKRTELSVDKMPKAKTSENMEKIRNAASRVFKTEEATNYNTAVTARINHEDAAEQSSAKIMQIQKSVESLTKTVDEQKKVQQILGNVNNWRNNVKQAGVPKTNVLSPTDGVAPSRLSVGKDGKVNNVWGVNGDTVERIVSVKPLEYPAGSAHMIGENGGEYYSMKHYANYRSTQNTTYVLIAKPEGSLISDVHPDVKNFSYSIDSGD